jgi:indole-3-glycerol phosphate synthase
MTILAGIPAARRKEVAERERRVPLEALRLRAESAPEPRDFLGALRDTEGVALIAEAKRASPSAGHGWWASTTAT